MQETGSQRNTGSEATGNVKLKFVVAGRTVHVVQFKGEIHSRPFTDPVSDSWPSEAAAYCGPEEVLYAPSYPVPERLSLLALTRGVLRYVPAQYPRYYLDVRTDYPQCFNRLSAKARSELRRKKRKFENGSSEAAFFREFRYPDEMSEFHALARQVSEVSYQERLGEGLPEAVGFESTLIEQALRDRVRGFVLLQGDRPVAYEYCSVSGDCVTGELCGYDPEFAKLSPGSVLLACVVERLSKDKAIRLLDFGTGDASYKAAVATGSVRCADIYYFPLRTRFIAIVLAHATLLVFWKLVIKVLENVRLRDRLRKMFRRW